jgi:hypothetical protein
VIVKVKGYSFGYVIVIQLGLFDDMITVFCDAATCILLNKDTDTHVKATMACVGGTMLFHSL